MAQLKDLIVNGASRLIGDAYANSLQVTTLKIPSASGGSTFTAGTNGYVIKSNGSSVYWAADTDSDTHRPINVNGTQILASNTTALNLKSGTYITVTATGGDVTFNCTLSSLAAASGGTAVSLVTTGEKNTWNSKTSNTGTVTSVAPGSGLKSIISGTTSGTSAISTTGTLLIYWGTSSTDVTTANSATGTSGTVADAGHKHKISVATGDGNGQVKIAGTNVSVKGLGSAAYSATTAFAASSHAHGNITSSGTVTATATAANNYHLLYTSSTSAVVASNIVFDGSTITKALTPNGTWENVANSVAGMSGTVTLKSLDLFGKTYNGSSAVTITPEDIGLSGSMNFKGVVTNNLSDGATTNPVTLKAGGSVTATEGDVVIDSGGEQYVWSNGGWRSLGYATDYALGTHIHGNLANNGTVSTTATIAAGFKLAVLDGSNNLTGSSITFTGSTGKFLREDGTWVSVTTTDTKVSQPAAITTAGNYPVILAYSTATSAVTNAVKKTSTLTYNPSTTKLHTPILEITTASYGNTLPTTGLSTGQLFFQTAGDNLYEIPTGGKLGAPLIHQNSNTGSRAVVWQNQYDFSADAAARFKIVGVTKGTTPASNHWQGIYFMDDSDDPEGGDKAYGYIGSWVTNTGKVETRMYTYDATATSSHNAYLYVAADGIGNEYLRAGVINAPFYGAVWNDYAEFRETEDDIEPGRCIVENGDDTLVLSTERLQRGCEIVSDTFGFAIGKTKKAKTPTAASGRVLAYLYENREEAKKKIGWPVCSGPNGTVSIMTEEEEEKYPSRIIGTISSVPDYEIWYANSDKEEDKEHASREIPVNGRIWIRVR